MAATRMSELLTMMFMSLGGGLERCSVLGTAKGRVNGVKASRMRAKKVTHAVEIKRRDGDGGATSQP